ncbi:MAG: DUF333 domain-containing protein [Candidatus Pacearchaeota archaeon]
MKKIFVFVCILLIFALVLVTIIKFPESKDKEKNQSNQSIPNPASVYCIEHNGTLEIRENEQGQYGVCIFPDGSECEEWSYYQGECKPGEKFKKP